MSDLISRSALMQFPIRINNYDKKNGNEHFVLGIESVLEFAEYLPAVEAVEVVRCKDCIYWQNRKIRLDDGTCRDYLPDEPFSVDMTIGINVGEHCTLHGFEDKSGSWFWAHDDDYCSRAIRAKESKDT